MCALNGLHYEVIIIDDGSIDSTEFCVKKFEKDNPDIALIYLKQVNMGKGGAIRSGIKHSKGRILVVQDADLEYDPKDIRSLLEPFSSNAQVVYGSRNINRLDAEHSSLLFYWGGLLITKFTNLLFGSKLTDEATGYKLFHKEIFEDLSFVHNDFAWEPEITAKILKKDIKIIELPISYKPRSKKEGKKISWVDGVKAIWVLTYERFFNN